MNPTQDRVLGIIKGTERWLRKHEPEMYLDCQDIIKGIVDGIKYEDRDPDMCLEQFEDWIEDLLRMG